MTREQLLLEFNMRYMPIDGHWIWQGYKYPNGYGVLKIRQQQIEHRFLAHRLSMHLFSTLDLYSHDLALHKCDRKDCVNPDHLYIGNQFDNMRDMKASRNRKDNETGAKNQTPYNK